MRYYKKHEFKKSPSCIKSRQPVCRAAALGMAGAVLVLHAGASSASACLRPGSASFAEDQQTFPGPYAFAASDIIRTGSNSCADDQQMISGHNLRACTEISCTVEKGEKNASDKPDQDSVLERWGIDPDDLPPEEQEEIPSVPEEIREYFEEAVAGIVEKYDGSVPPASDLSKYSLRADTVRAGVRAKARGFMKKESGCILDRMNSFALSFGGPAIAKMTAEMQSRTAGKLTAFGKGQEEEDMDHSAGGTGLFSSSSGSFENSTSTGESSAGGSSARIPFLSIIPPLKEESGDKKAGPADESRDYEAADISRTDFPAKEDSDNPVETSASPGDKQDPDSDLSHTPPGMYSFLSYLPGGKYSSGQPELNSGEAPSESFRSEEDLSESISSEENSSESFRSEEDSSGNFRTGEDSSAAFVDEEGSADDSSRSFSGSLPDTCESEIDDIEIFPDLTANFALARPFTSGRLYYKYANKGSDSSVRKSDEKDSSGDLRDHSLEETPGRQLAAHRNVVFIGDSRTVGMEMFVGGREDEYWCAKNSMGYSWMVNSAAPSVDNLIGENTDVVILMGVNDLGNVSLYVDYMNEKAAEWKERGARTFFVSVTPVVDSKSPNAKNSRIENFNAYAIEHLRNVHYIDAYNRIRYSFGSPDGIHFDAATYREIYRIIHFYLYQGWYEQAGLRFYFDCGEPLTGWHLLDGAWQYMDGAGVRWISNSRVGDVCLAPYPMTGLTDPDAGVLSSMDTDTSALE